MAAVGQGIFTDAVRIFGGDHFTQKFFVGLCGRFHYLAVFKPQLNARYFVAVAIGRLVEAYPSFSTAPIGRCKYFETRNVASGASVPVALFAELDPKVHIGADGVQSINLR